MSECRQQCGNGWHSFLDFETEEDNFLINLFRIITSTRIPVILTSQALRFKTQNRESIYNCLASKNWMVKNIDKGFSKACI